MPRSSPRTIRRRSRTSKSSSGPMSSRTARSRRPNCGARSACRPSIEPLAGGRSDRRRARRRPVHGADHSPPIGTTVRAGQVLGRLEPRLAAGDDRATLAARGRRGASGALRRRARNRRGPNGCWQSAPCPRAGSRTRAGRSPSPKPDCRRREARLDAARRNPAQRRRRRGGNAFVLRAPIGGRVAEVMATLGASYDEGAPLFRIVRTDRVELRAQVPAADAAAARDVADVALEIPGRADPLCSCAPTTCTTPVSSIRRRGRVAGAVRGARTLAANCSSVSTGRPSSTSVSAFAGPPSPRPPC